MKERSSHVPDVFVRLEQGGRVRAARIEAFRQAQRELATGGLVLVHQEQPRGLRIPKAVLPLAAALELLALSACTRPEEEPALGFPVNPPAATAPATPTETATRTPELRSLTKSIVEFRQRKLDSRGQPIVDRNGNVQWEPAITIGSDGKSQLLASAYFLPETKVVSSGSFTELTFNFTNEGSRLLKQIITRDNLIGIVVDGRFIEAYAFPQDAKSGIIRGLGPDEANRLAERLNIEANPYKMIPFRIEASEGKPLEYSISPRPPAQYTPREYLPVEGWKWISVLFGLENTRKEPAGALPFSLDKAVIFTKEGFQYTAAGTAYPGPFVSEKWPPGFRMLGRWSYGGYGQLYEGRYGQIRFRIAEKTTPTTIKTPGFPDIDLTKQLTDISQLKFPTDRPDSDFKELVGSSFSIPNKGTITFLDIQQKGSRARNPDAVDIVIRVRFTNESIGESRSFSVGFSGIFGNDGIYYDTTVIVYRPSVSIGITVGPGLSKEQEFSLWSSLPKRNIEGKFITAGDVNEIFNLRLGSTATQPEKSAPTSESEKLNAYYHEQCKECGATFTVDRLEIIEGKLRIPMSIENTGERGNLQLIFDQNGLYVFDRPQSTQFRNEFARAFAQNKLNDLIDRIKPKLLILNPERDAGLPTTLKPGDSWQGSFRMQDSSFPKDAVALIIHLGDMKSEKPSPDGDYTSGWMSLDNSRPFIEIKR